MDYIELGTSIAREAGVILRHHFRATKIQVEWKDDNTPLTLADKAVNAMVLERLSAELPHFSLIGEEGSLEKPESEYQAVFDPCDGTFGFSNGVPTFVFAIAFCHRGKPFACVVYDPVLDRMFTAENGKGAFLNGQRIHVNRKSLAPNAVVGMSWARSQGDLIEVRRYFSENSIAVLELLSSLYTACLVAMGTLAVSIYAVRYPWDGACAKLLVEEAGGIVTSITGKEQRYDGRIDGIVAGNPVAHRQACGLLLDRAVLY